MRAGAAVLLPWLVACAPKAALLLPPATQEDLVFTQYSPLSSNEEIARRTLTPLTFRELRGALAGSGQPIDLSREKFSVYVPAGPRPEAGYGLLVFVAPWPDATRPRNWRPPLDRHGLIFVSAANSGNDAKVLDRRLPLALLAYENVRARHPIDPARVYVGGLSGGSRVAEMTALAYPDVFRGVLLNAGSDPVDGGDGMYLPPADLFRKFQRTRVVFVTGEHDELNLDHDGLTRASLRHDCVFDIEVRMARRLGHEPLDAVSLGRALDALDERSAVDPAELARCNARLQQELDADLAGARAAIARGDRDGARKRIQAIDARYGGLAAPAIYEVADQLAGARPGDPARPPAF